MQSRIVRPDPALEFYTSERCFILESWNSPDDEGVSIARARVEPGVTTALHAVTGTIERYLIVSGRGVVEIDTLAPSTVAPGDVVVIAPGRRQRITNAGDIDLVFYAICTPRFRPQAYEPLEPE